MKLIYTILFFLFYSYIQSQTDRVLFKYDNAGNQIERKLCINCFESKQSNSDIKEDTKIASEEPLKFFQEDLISYFPNPVKEELYLKWELVDNNKVTSIDIFSINGQLIKSYKDLEKENNTSLYFSAYPSNTYLVILNYKNGDQKSITIIKN